MTKIDARNSDCPRGPARERASCRSSDRRRGFTILELVGTCFLLGVMFTITVPMLMIVARERRSTEQRQFALRHLENLLEETTSRPAAELAIGEQPLADPDPDLTAILPGLERNLTVRSIEGEPDTLLVVGTIRWQMAGGKPGVPMQLSAWVHSAKGGSDAK
jgi:hypothetical protein